MPYNPAGLFSLVASYFANPGTTIRTEQHNPVFEDIQSALSQVYLKDGRAPMTGPLNMNGFPINGVGPGQNADNVATVGQSSPIGSVVDFAGTVAPAGWMLCYGQALNRTTYAKLFAVIGTTFGAGDGSTTFNLPDLRGFVVAGKDDMGGNAVGRLSAAGAVNGTVLGYGGGNQFVQLNAGNIPSITSRNSSQSISVLSSADGVPLNTNPDPGVNASGGSYGVIGRNGGTSPVNVGRVTSSGNNDITVTSTNTSGGSLGANANNVQPTFILQKIMRVSYDG